MRMQSYYQSRKTRAGGILLLGLLLVLGLVGQTEAAVTVESYSGNVEVLFDQEQSWQPLSHETTLEAGDQILVGTASSADLVCEDGSTLHLDEETQLAIKDLEFSLSQEVRVSKLTLFWGKVTAKAATFTGFKKNTFEIETDTVVAGVKFSSLTITSGENGTQIIPIEGAFEFSQIDGNTQINYEQNGIKVRLALPADARITMHITPDEPVQITTNETPVTDVTVRTTSDAGTVDSTLNIPAETTVLIGKDPVTDETTIGSDTDMDVRIGDETITITAGSEIGVKATATGAEIHVNEGMATVGDQTVNAGDPPVPIQATPAPSDEEAEETEDEEAADEATPVPEPTPEPEETRVEPPPPELEAPPDERTGSPTVVE